jgi:hypothetical protein
MFTNNQFKSNGPPDPPLPAGSNLSTAVCSSSAPYMGNKSKFEKMRLRVSAEMTVTLIHRLPMNWKWVRAQEVPGAEQHGHGKILYLRIRIAPRNGCFTDGLRR